MFKRAKVVMLPTKKKAQLFTIKYGLGFSNPAIENVNKSKNQHLYITSDDEIKDGDWYLNSLNNYTIHQYKGEKLPSYGVKKIIATTDKLIIGWGEDTHPTQDNGKPIYLPQLSQAFIKVFVREYNKGNIIADVLVEYYYPSYIENGNNNGIMLLKINPKDNTITIKKVKDSWNREEYETGLRQAFRAGMERESLLRRGFIKEAKSENNWIEENL